MLGSGQRETYTTSIMTARNFYDKIRYRRKKSGFKRDGFGKGKKMFTVIRSSYLYPESLKNASLDHKEEWSFVFVCSDKNGLERNAVVKGVGLSQYG